MDDQDQQKEQKSGPISQGINVVNTIPLGKPGSFGRVGLRVTTQAARGFVGFLAANPWIWVVLGIIILIVVVFAIVVSGVAPGSPPQTTTPALEP